MRGRDPWVGGMGWDGSQRCSAQQPPAVRAAPLGPSQRSVFCVLFVRRYWQVGSYGRNMLIFCLYVCLFCSVVRCVFRLL